MIAARELAQVDVFSEMAAGEQERFAQTAADLRLEAGGTIIHEGERSRFYVLLDGTVQLTKDIHGVQHVLGDCGPGEFFGELTGLMGVPSSVAITARTRCRLARFELQQLQELIDPASSSSGKILRRMSERVLNIQQFAQGVPSTRVVLTAPREDHVCHRIRSFLAANHVPYQWQVSDPVANGQPPSELTVIIDGDRRLVDPTLREVAEALGFQTGPKRDTYDVVIVGAGPAGMAAGVYGASEGLGVLLVERGSAGGQAGSSSRIENYLGFPGGISGDDLSDRALKQALRFGAEIAMARSVEGITPRGKGYCVALDAGERVFSRCVLVATGVDWRRLAVPGLDDYLGKGVLYGASRTEAHSVTGKRVFIVGAGNSAGQAAMFFSEYAEQVCLLVRGGNLATSMSQYLIDQLEARANISVELATEVVALRGEGVLGELVTATRTAAGDRQERTWSADALFIMIGAVASTGWLPPELQRDSKGFICTGRAVTSEGGDEEPLPLETSMPGLFCAGDVRHGSVKRVASGVGEGSMSITFIHQYLASAL